MIITCKDINILELRQLCEHAVRLNVVATSNSQQETVLVGEHRLNFVVRQIRQVFWVEERVTATVQFHVTIHLYKRSGMKPGRVI